MPHDRDMTALLKRLLAREVTDADDNEVLDEIIGLADALPPADAVTVTETTSFVGIVGVSKSGFCEVG